MASSNLQCSNTACGLLGLKPLQCQACPIYTPKPTVEQNINNFRKVIQTQLDRKNRERQGLLPENLSNSYLVSDASGPVDPVVQIVLDNQYLDFGFPIYRVNYDDEEKWQRWYEKFDELLDSSLEQSAGGEAIMNRLIMYRVEDEELNHMPFEAVKDYHALMLSDRAYPLSYDTGVGLAVDSAVLCALLDPVPGVPPWIYVFDETHDFSQSQDDLTVDDYLGYMPVAIESLLPYLWPDLQSDLSLFELWAAWSWEEERGVWTDSLGF